MTCRELAGLRAEVKELNAWLSHQRAAARSTARLRRGRHTAGQSDYEPLLKRKLEQLAQMIQRHKAEHGCED